MSRILAIAALLSFSGTVSAQEAAEPHLAAETAEKPAEEPAVKSELRICMTTDTAACVRKEDLKKFLQLAKERKCLDETAPIFKLDPVVVITDEDGRVFYSGSDASKPYKLKMKWCHYDIEAAGKINLTASQKEPETWGFRFRPKAYLGYLPFKTLAEGSDFNSGIDAGLMLDLFHWKWVNLNIATGFRSVGIDLGADITTNCGLSVGGGYDWSFQPDLRTSFWFAF